ncbi:DUF6452 family protein [uncultured Bacteroides sp.]|uniref:DUF6452 family protein n=1 Tax=uncultured Bacteroides sp. TaxID=162156 RepID=UPI002AA7CCED|nr:DUF6452 family protein [uncultured Bacteroides sp.]
MKNLVRIIFLLAVITVLIGISSCAEETSCSLDGRPMLRCYLYTLAPNTITAKKDTLDSLTVTAFGTDSIIINNQKKVHDIALPLRYTKDSTIFVIHYSATLTDTIIIGHSNTPKFISMDCGYQMQQSIISKSYSKHKLDSIYISNKDANTDGTENLKLFY